MTDGDNGVNSPCSAPPVPRRIFLKGLVAGAGALATAPGLLARELIPDDAARLKPAYRGPKVIIVRFGGGARRRETIDSRSTYSPFLCHELAKRGTLFKNMEISSFAKMESIDGKGRPVEIETSRVTTFGALPVS